MTAIADLEHRRVIHHGTGIGEESCGLGKRPESVERTGRGGCLLQRGDLIEHRCAETLENLDLQGACPLLGSEDLSLHLLEFRCDESLPARRSLLTGVIVRNAAEIGGRHLDEVPKDGIETNLQRLDPRTGDLALLQGGDPSLPLGRGIAEFIQRGVISGANHSSLTDRGRRLIDKCRTEQGRQFGKRVQVARQLLKKPAASIQHGTDRRNPGQRGGQHLEIAGGTGVLTESGDGPLDIANSAKSVTQITQLHRRSDERSHGLLAGSNRGRIDQRMQNPVAQSSSPHGGYRAVERSHERHGATRPRDDQLEMPLRGGVEQ